MQFWVIKVGVISAGIFIASSFMSVQAASKTSAKLGNVEDPIVIPTHNWSSQIVMSNIVGQLFEKIGYQVNYQPIGSQAVYESVRNGDVHLELEVWEGSFATSFNAAMDKGGIIDAGSHDVITREGWWYPAYVADQCPGLPDWRALDKCYEMFVTSNTAPDARFLDGPAQWFNDSQRIEALGMRFKTVNASGIANLWSELEAAAGRQEPIVLFNWSPNFTDVVYGGTFVEFPEFDPACKTDASWGVNPNMTDDCGGPSDGNMKKVAWDGMPRKWPAAYKVLTRINFTTNMVGTLSKLVDIDGMEIEDAASKWIEDNKEVWLDWLYAAQ